MHDIGVYVLQLAQYVFPGESPVDIKVTGQKNDQGVDVFAGILMEFPDKKFAVMSVNALTVMSNTAEIIGTKGFIQLPKFWCPTEIITPDGMKSFPLPESQYELKFFNSTGLGYEAEEARRCIEQGKSSYYHYLVGTLTLWIFQVFQKVLLFLSKKVLNLQNGVTRL